MTPAAHPPSLKSIDAITAALADVGYISTRQISTAIYLAHHLRKPVLIEGPAGVGKTDEEIASFISYAMFAPDGARLVVQNGPNKGRLVRDVFLPHIEDFLKRKQSSARLSAEVVDAWLRAVLSAWRNLVRDLFPQKFHTELLAVRGELALAGGQ